MALAKLSAKKYSRQEIDPIIRAMNQHVVQQVHPESVFLIGSCTRNAFTDYSDIDFVIVVETDDDVRHGRKMIHLGRPHQSIPVDFILMSKEAFDADRDLGGMAFEATHNGELLYRRDENVP